MLFTAVIGECKYRRNLLLVTKTGNLRHEPKSEYLRAGDDYDTVASTFTWFPGVPVYHSTDLMNWELIGYCFTRQSIRFGQRFGHLCTNNTLQ